MVLASPFSSLQDAISTARDIWFNKVDVNGWLEAFSVNFLIGEHRASAPATDVMAQFSNSLLNIFPPNFRIQISIEDFFSLIFHLDLGKSLMKLLVIDSQKDQTNQ